MGSEQGLPPHFQSQNYQQMRQAASASPPVTNGGLPYHPRQRTPQPPGMGSRPASRNQNGPIPRPGSNLNPQVSHPPNVPNGYAYMQNQAVHHPHGMPVNHPHPGPYPPHHQYSYPPHGPPHPGMQQPFVPEQQRRPSGPPTYPPADRPRSQPPQPHPPPPHRQTPSPPQPQPQPERRPDTLQPHQPKPLPPKARSIFTPIDDSNSLLAQHWGMGSSTAFEHAAMRPVDPPLKAEKEHRAQSVDVGAVTRATQHPPVVPSPPARPGPTRPARGLSQPQRTASLASLSSGGGARPKLKVQIPSEQSDDGADTGTASSPPGPNGQPAAPGQPVITTTSTSSGAPTAKTSASEPTSHPSGAAIHLPPPSPSASALLSAGASGPANPFARPLPPPAPPQPAGSAATSRENAQAYAGNNSIETPMSALPSRFAEGLLPSPSSFYPEWNFGGGGAGGSGGGGGGGGRTGSVGGQGGDGNLLPSPLAFPTPLGAQPPMFGRDEGGAVGEKRKGSGEGVVGGEAKKIKA